MQVDSLSCVTSPVTVVIEFFISVNFIHFECYCFVRILINNIGEGIDIPGGMGTVYGAVCIMM